MNFFQIIFYYGIQEECRSLQKLRVLGQDFFFRKFFCLFIAGAGLLDCLLEQKTEFLPTLFCEIPFNTKKCQNYRHMKILFKRKMEIYKLLQNLYRLGAIF